MKIDKVNAFLDLVDSGVIDSRDALGNILVNFLSVDEAEDFIDSEYSDYFGNEDDEWEAPESFYSTEDEDMNI